jgi:hypothetical protein
MQVSASVVALLLMELVNSGYSASEVINASPNKTFSEGKQPFFTAQSVKLAYQCVASAELTSPTPPIANYRASITCTVGRPIGFFLRLYNANVNFPADERYIGPNNYSCPSGIYCVTPTYTRTIDRTQYLWVYVGVNVMGSDGIIYTVSNATRNVRTYNDRGSAYPLIQPTRLDMPVVPFPIDPPYVERIPRAPDFADKLRQIYVTQGWVIPPAPVAAHHIKPIAWGGGNDPSINGVFLGSDTHQLFTTWWASFSNLNW